MSWNTYLENMVAQSKDPSEVVHIDKGCIIGLDGGAKWTTDDHNLSFKVTVSEAEKIAKCFKTKDMSNFQANGIYIEGVKYQFIRELDGFAAGKKKDHGSITLQASQTAIVIGHCPEGSQQGMANKAVSHIADYLGTLNM